MFIDDIIASCRENADKTAFICGSGQISYDELYKNALSLAAHLSGSYAPVLILGHKSPDMLISMLACLFCGRAYVPCDSSMPVKRIEYIIAAADCKTLCAAEDILMSTDAEVITRERLHSIYKSEAAFSPVADADRTAYIIFTSGSTGAPKGVPVSVGNLDCFVRWITGINELSPLKGGVALNTALFSFDLSVADIYFSLCCGGTLRAVPSSVRDSFTLLEAELSDSGAELMVTTPSYAALCLCSRRFSAELMPRLKAVFFCGERLPARTVRKLFERFPELTIINAYGPTEATCAVTAAVITRAMAESAAIPIGMTDCCSVRLTIEDGEIVLEGGSVFNGYLHSGKPTRGRYRTGDLGSISDGFVYFGGRLDEQLKLKGYRIEPAELETALLSVDGVLQAAVLPVISEDGMVMRLNAYAVPADETLTAEMIRSELSLLLPPYMLPAVIRLVGRLPMNANGKLDRKALERLK